MIYSQFLKHGDTLRWLFDPSEKPAAADLS